MKNLEQKAYWERRIDRFDRIYDDNEGLREITFLSKLVEPFRRKSLRERFAHAAGYLRETGIEGRTFIDGGCGAGRITEFLLNGGAAMVWAVDITERAIAIARERIESACPGSSGRVRFVVGDISAIELPAADCLVGLGLVEYLEGLDGFLLNIRKSGRFIINYPLRRHWKRPLRMMVERFERSTRHYYEPAEMEAAAAPHGFRLEKRIPFGASMLEAYRKTG